MRTDELVAALAADPRPGPGVGHVLARSLPVALIVPVVALLAGFGLRPDMVAALAPLTLPKTVLPVALAVLALMLAWRSAHPGQGVGRLGLLLLAVPAVAAMFGFVRLVGADPSGWLAEAQGASIAKCLVSIPALAAVPLAALLWSLRRGAPLSPARLGFAAGLVAGGLSAALYSLHCNEDSPLFWSLWYSLGILVTGVAGALIGGRVLRW